MSTVTAPTPAPVRYRGTLFRSQLEVRVGGAFSQAGCQWSYEPERYYLDSSRTFLPDFLLPLTGIFLEVKGWLT
jgi:hypothetical protein